MAEKLTPKQVKEKMRKAKGSMTADKNLRDINAALNNWAEKTSEMTGEHLPEMKNQLQELVRLTGNTTLAEKSYMVALDMSKSGLMDMESAVKIVSKAVNGHTEALARYGIQIDKNATSQEFLNTLTKKFGGGEDSYLKTTAGQRQIAQNNFNLLKNELGQVFLPVLDEIDKRIKDALSAAGIK